MSRREWTSRHIAVSHDAIPWNRENGPHLKDFREFVAMCDGLPDDALVRVDTGTLNESGRRNVTFSLRLELRQEEATQ